jgi:hypothetical protein
LIAVWSAAFLTGRRLAPPRAANAPETPPGAGTAGMKLETQEIGISSVHASLVMFINAGIRLTLRVCGLRKPMALALLAATAA